MSKRRFLLSHLKIFVVGSLLAIGGCKNLFNPNGSVNSKDMSATELIQYGEQLLREGRENEAYSVFQSAILKDSTLSMAYYGKAKAILRIGNVNPTVLVDLVIELQKENASAAEAVSNYVASLDESLTDAIQEMTDALAPLIRRDTINTAYLIYNKYKDEASPNFAAGEEVKYNYFKKKFVDKENANYALQDFPIMDGLVTKERIKAEFQIGTAINTFKSISELLGDGEELSTLINDLTSGDKDLKDLATFQEAINDTAKRENLNNIIDQISSGVSVLDIAPDLLENGGNTGDSTQSSSDIQQQIDQAGESIIFYKIADAKDNDGDGCVDEEIYDGVDNDLDGIIDEDLRAAPIDLVDNNTDGSVDNASELVNPIDTVLVYVSAAGYIKGPSYQDKSVRLAIQKDVEFDVYSIEERRSLIGGCW